MYVRKVSKDVELNNVCRGNRSSKYASLKITFIVKDLSKHRFCYLARTLLIKFIIKCCHKVQAEDIIELK